MASLIEGRQILDQFYSWKWFKFLANDAKMSLKEE